MQKQNITAEAIHGDKTQSKRQHALKRFRNKEITVLVATDIAARGVDIDKLRYVINYDMPNTAETYVHRIGRSGRAKEEGVSISMCDPEELAFLRDIEKLIKQKIQLVENHPFPQTEKPLSSRSKKAFKRVFEKEKRQKQKTKFKKTQNKRQENTQDKTQNWKKQDSKLSWKKQKPNFKTEQNELVSATDATDNKPKAFEYKKKFKSKKKQGEDNRNGRNHNKNSFDKADKADKGKSQKNKKSFSLKTTSKKKKS